MHGMCARRRRRSALAAGILALAAPAWGFTAAQVAAGGRTYQRECARCHGADGRGKAAAFKNPGAPPREPRPYQRLRHEEFHTAKDVYDFVSATMPADQPAILSREEYLDVVAYLLARNGMAADQTPLTVPGSATVPLQAAHGQAGR